VSLDAVADLAAIATFGLGALAAAAAAWRFRAAGRFAQSWSIDSLRVTYLPELPETELALGERSREEYGIELVVRNQSERPHSLFGVGVASIDGASDVGKFFVDAGLPVLVPSAGTYRFTFYLSPVRPGAPRAYYKLAVLLFVAESSGPGRRRLRLRRPGSLGRAGETLALRLDANPSLAWGARPEYTLREIEDRLSGLPIRLWQYSQLVAVLHHDGTPLHGREGKSGVNA
jgi:hypothetical protein